MTYRKKLIEVALPLEAINKASAREKSIRHGHPSTLHLWWARRPLAACRAGAETVTGARNVHLTGINRPAQYILAILALEAAHPGALHLPSVRGTWRTGRAQQLGFAAHTLLT